MVIYIKIMCNFKKLELNEATKYLISIMPIHKAQTAVRAYAQSQRRESQRCMKAAVSTNTELLFQHDY